MEAREGVGGIWLPEPRVAGEGREPGIVDWRGLSEAQRSESRPMYDGLHTNLPDRVMVFPDQPWQYGCDFPSQAQVLDYLQHCSRDEALAGRILFNTKVHSVRLNETDESWSVRFGHPEETRIFDAVIAANGHYSRPVMPEVPGLLEHFAGTLAHSSAFRNPSQVAGKTVLIIGMGFSGIDIASIVAATASCCYLSSKHDPPHSQPRPLQGPQVHQVSRLVSVTPSQLNFADGALLPHVDIILMATGFAYDYPFFRTAAGQPAALVTVSENQVSPLFMHLVHALHPSLILPGIPFRVIPFFLLYFQAQWVCQTWCGLAPLEDRSARLRALEAFEEEMQHLPKRHAHLFGDKQFAYMEELCKRTGLVFPNELKLIWFAKRF